MGLEVNVAGRLVMRQATVGLFSALLIVGVSCGGDDDDSSENTGGGSTQGGGGSAGIAGSSGASPGGDGGGGASNTVGECETIEGLNVTTECASSSLEAQLNAVNMLLVMDKSTSMEDPFDDSGAGGTGAGSETRWDALKAALRDALTETEEAIDYGLLLYPSGDGCAVGDVQVPVGEGSETVPQVAAALDENSPDVSGTPMAAALDVALEYYTNGAGQDLEGDKYVLLATDGGPNCNEELACPTDECTLNIEGTCGAPEGENCCAPDTAAARISCLDDDAVTAKVEALYEAGIRTFVVGIPGSEYYATSLTRFAAAGYEDPDGNPGEYYSIDGSQGAEGLADTFKEIALQLVKDCTIPLNTGVPSTNEVNVAVDCTVIPKNGETSSWRFSEDTTRIFIEGEWCETIKTTGVERIDVILGCPVVY